MAAGVIDGWKARRAQRKLGPLGPGYIEPEGVHYLDFLGHAHRVLTPKWYLEIGTQKGRSLRHAQGKSIAVDPAFILESPAMGAKPGLHLFQLTSDAFFETGFLARNEISIDMAFLDGMHLFEFLLRDFIGTEAHAAPGARVFMHDCLPRNPVMAKRTWDKTETNSWTGDVWKLVPILQEHRPDLTITTWDCPPTGLVMVEGLDRENTTLKAAYEDILAAFTDQTIETYGAARFFSALPMASSASALAAGSLAA